MYFPGILSKATYIMTRTLPDRIVESLSIQEGQVQVEILQRGHRYCGSSACSSNKRRPICCRHGQTDWIRSARNELIFSSEPQIVLEIVVYRSIRTTKLERVIAVDPGYCIFKLHTPLMNDVWSSEGPSKSSEPTYDHSHLRRVWRSGNRRISRRHLSSRLIDQVASKVVGPTDYGRIVSIGKARIDGRRCTIVDTYVAGEVVGQRKSTVDIVAIRNLIIYPGAPGVKARYPSKSSLIVSEDLPGIWIDCLGRG